MSDQPGGGLAAEEQSQAPKKPAEAKNVLKDDPKPETGESGLTADEERQLGELQARRDAAAAKADVTRFKVEAPHSELRFGGVSVGREFTPVPTNMIAPLAEAAANAGVTLTQEEEKS
jgi:hypothetical protein